MRNRTIVTAAAAAATAAFAAGSVGAAVASTSGTKPPAKHVSAIAKGGPSNGLGTQLGVSPARMDRALREVRTALVKSKAKPTEGQFAAELAHFLGIPEARVQRAFAAAKAATQKVAPSPANQQADQRAFVTTVARELHVSTLRATEVLRPLLARGSAYTSSQAIAEAAHLLGVSVGQLNTALMHGKQSIAGGK